MSFIEATITGDDKIAARFDALPNKLRASLIDSMRRQGFRVQAQVVTGKLSGDPLHRRTGNLASSINVALTEDPSQVTVRVGTKVRYGAVHEYGGTFQIPAHTRHVTSVFGRQVPGHDVQVRAHTATYPQRSFLRSTLSDMRSSVIAAIQADIDRATKE